MVTNEHMATLLVDISLGSDFIGLYWASEVFFFYVDVLAA